MGELTDASLKDISKHWAQEITLRQLSEKVGNSNVLLKAIASGKKIEADSIKEFDESVSEATKGLDENTKKQLAAGREAVNRQRAEREIEANKRELNEKYKDSINDLRRSLGKISNLRTGDVLDSAQEKISVFSGKLSESGGAARLLSGGLRVLNMSVTAASFAFGVYAGLSKNFLKLVDSGLTFNGSLEQFTITALQSGISLEKFAEISGKYSQTAAVLGEKQFSENIKLTQSIGKVSGYLGMMPDEFADATASFADMLRQTGRLAFSSQESLSTGTVGYLQNLTALSIITGKNRKELEAEQAKVKARASVKLALATIAKERGNDTANKASEVLDQLIATRGENIGLASFMQSFNGTGMTSQVAQELVMGGMSQSDIGGVNLYDPQRAIQQNNKYMEKQASVDPRYLSNTAGIQEYYGGKYAGASQSATDNYINSINATQGGNAKERWTKAFAVLNGTSPVDKTMTQYLNVQYDLIKVENSLKEAVMTLAEKFDVFGKINSALSSVTNLAANVSPQVGQTIEDHPLAAAGVALGGLYALKKGGGYALKKGGEVAASSISNLVKGLPLGGEKTIAAITEKDGLKVAEKMGAKTLGKSLLKKIPGLGLLAGLYFAADRALQGDWVGAGLETMSGASSLLPGLGTAGSVGIDATIAARDVYNSQQDTSSQTPDNNVFADMSPTTDNINLEFRKLLQTLVMELSADGPLYKLLMDLSQITQDGHRKLVTAVQNN